MKHIKKLVTLSMAGLLLAGAASPLATVNAASVKTASTAYQQSKTKASYQYAKKMLSRTGPAFPVRPVTYLVKKPIRRLGPFMAIQTFSWGLKAWGTSLPRHSEHGSLTA